MADPPLQKISISGATLAMIMQRFTTSNADCDGLLFGHVQSISSLNLADNDDEVGVREDLVATITGYSSCGFIQSFYDGAGRVDHVKLTKLIGDRDSKNQDPLIGWYTARRNSPLRPSMRESAVTARLRTSQNCPPSLPDNAGAASRGSDCGLQRNVSSRVLKGTLGLPYSESSSGSHSSRSPVREKDVTKDKVQQQQPQLLNKFRGIPASSPCLFFIFSESFNLQFIHTHEYRAFQYRPRGRGYFFEAKSVDIVNIGPGFRSQYSVFAPVSGFPPLPGSFDSLAEDTADSRSGREDRNSQKSRQGSGKLSGSGVGREQCALDIYSSGFSVDRLARLAGPDAAHRVSELEELYGRMISKLEFLAKQVGESSVAVAEQEKHNMKLRSKIAGID